MGVVQWIESLLKKKPRHTHCLMLFMLKGWEEFVRLHFTS